MHGSDVKTRPPIRIYRHHGSHPVFLIRRMKRQMLILVMHMMRKIRY